MKYIKKPIPVEAVKIVNEMHTLDEWDQLLPVWFKNALVTFQLRWTDDGMYVKSLEGEMFAPWGSYIVKGTEGELYPVRGNIFEKTYEPYEDDVNE